MSAARPPAFAAIVAALMLAACGADRARPSRATTADDRPTRLRPTTGAAGDRPGRRRRLRAEIDPADFSDVVDNPFLPLLPGARWVYEERTADGEVEEIVVEVLDERRTVMGVSTIVVHDVASVDGEVIEDTYDWFAQDSAGNVWYFGEDTTVVRRRRCGQHEGRVGGRRRRRPARAS